MGRPVGPLTGWRVRCPPTHERALVEAARLLAALGARLEPTADHGVPVLSVRPTPDFGWGTTSVRLSEPVSALPGLPAAVAFRTAGELLVLAALAAAPYGGEVVVDPVDVTLLLLLPTMLSASYDAPPNARPGPLPRPDGWLSAELGAPGDVETFARMLATLPADAGVSEVAAEAQVWRLPVLPYRLPASKPPMVAQHAHMAVTTPTPELVGLAGSPTHPKRSWRGGPHAASRDREPLAGVRVLDLTIMWAGPLATWLLAGLGASVTTIEPTVRPDGTRATRGGGIYPHGRLVPGGESRSAMFTALARGKRRWDLDLRSERGARALRHAVVNADVVVDNLSPRARQQLGVTAATLCRANPDLLTVTVPAFGPEDPRRGWVAYGGQVHADSGLAWGDRPPSPAQVSVVPPLPAATAYVDPMTGVLVATVAVAALWGRAAGWRPHADLEVPLSGSVRGLVPYPDDADRLRADPQEAVQRVLTHRPDRLVPVRVGGEDFLHPRHPCSGAITKSSSADGPGPGVEWTEEWETWREELTGERTR